MYTAKDFRKEVEDSHKKQMESVRTFTDSIINSFKENIDKFLKTKDKKWHHGRNILDISLLKVNFREVDSTLHSFMDYDYNINYDIPRIKEAIKEEMLKREFEETDTWKKWKF